MQDMELHQSEIIDTFFGSTETILQKIGDINQSIYSRAESEDGADWQPVINHELQLVN